MRIVTENLVGERGIPPMETPNATRANAALWEQYIEEQYGRMLTAMGMPAMAALMGAAIANYYAAFWGDIIGRMFATNARDVTRFVQDSSADVLPRWTATPVPPQALDEPPPWLRDALDEIDRRQERQRAAATRQLAGAGV
jgi:hypothetical protein